jgi:serine/threonine protein kinase
MEIQVGCYNKDIDKNYNELKQLIEENMESLELKELIGYGGESYVYKSLIKNVKRPVTIKVIYNNKKHYKNSKEIEIANKLKNKNVVKCFGMKNIKNANFNCDCLVMEYSKFGNIRQFQRNFIKRNNMSESTLCYFASLILKGLKYCHMSKIAHYDIKPQNIIIDEALNLKLIDFSISINYKDKNKIKLPNQGTNHYRAPEVLNSEIIDTKDLEKVDLYSLGSMLFNLAFGVYPDEFTREELEEKYKILNEENNSNYSKYFFDFIKQLLQIDINKRINIKQAMEHYWIKGAEILIDEKEKISNANIFLSYLIFDFFPNFNKYIYK